jgi:hypothetical protein
MAILFKVKHGTRRGVGGVGNYQKTDEPQVTRDLTSHCTEAANSFFLTVSKTPVFETKESP